MRARARRGGGRGSDRRGAGGKSVPFNWITSPATHTRSTEGSAQTSASSLAWYGVNEARVEDRGGGIRGLLMEGARTQDLAVSPRDTTTWPSAASGAVSTTGRTGPDGIAAAVSWAATAGQYSRFVAIGTAGAYSSWIRSRNGNPIGVQHGAAAPDVYGANGNAWQRVSRYTAAAGSFTPIWYGGAVAANIDADCDLHQFESGHFFGTSCIRTAGATRGADARSYSLYPTSFRTAGFGVDIWPLYSSQNVIDGAIGAYVLWAFGTNDLIYIRASGGACNVALARGGAIVANVNVTFSALQRLSFDYVPGTGLTLSNFTTGNGLLAHAGSALPSVDLQLGASAGGAVNHNFAIYAPFPRIF